MTTWREAFPSLGDADGIPEPPAGFKDTSWGNDACPSFTNEALGLVIWADSIDPARREFTDRPRFLLATIDHSDDIADGSHIMSTDDWLAIAKALGRSSRDRGAWAGDNPYPRHTAESSAWNVGWQERHAERRAGGAS